MGVPGRNILFTLLFALIPGAAMAYGEGPRPPAPPSAGCVGASCHAPSTSIPTPQRPDFPSFRTPSHEYGCGPGGCGAPDVALPTPGGFRGPNVTVPTPNSDCGDQCGAPPALPTPTAGCGAHCDAPVIPMPEPGCGAACAPPAPPLPQVGCGAACDVAVVVPQPVITGPDVVTVGGAGAAASASSTAIAVAVSDGGEFVYRNGARGYASASAEAGVDSNAEALAGVSANVSADGAGDFQRATFSAACVSSDGASEPAAQTFPERDVRDDFVGELYRCTANARLRIDSGRGQTLCARGQSLWYARGALTCRTRTPQAAGYERMLMGRFGPGEKVARVQVTAAPQPVALRDASSLTPSSGGVGLSGW